MDAVFYKKRIVKYMKSVETYKPEFDKVIAVLSEIYQDLDEARKQFEDSGGDVVVEHTNQGGSTNLAKNPFFTTIMDLQDKILKYNSELGLTPAGYKKIKGDGMKDDKKKGGLIEALKMIEG